MPNDAFALLETSRGDAAARAEHVLRNRIRTGVYLAAQRLPTERALAAELGVHRGAVRAAIGQLALAGLIERNACCRPVVAPASFKGTGCARGYKTTAGRPAASRFIALIMLRFTFEEGAAVQQRVFWGLNSALSNQGYHATLLDLGEERLTDEENARQEENIVRYALKQDFAGIVACTRSYRGSRSVLQEAARQRPLVLIDHLIAGVEADYAGTQNFAGMRKAAEHLIGLGHKRIAYATSAEPINTVQDRLEGYRSAMRAADLAPRVLLAGNERDCAGLDSEWQRPAAERPTAVLCLNDWIALLLFSRLTMLGLSVPGDISMVGFDNIVHSLPNGVGLSTVAQPFEEIGRSAGELFLCRQRLPGAMPMHVELPAVLIPRESSAAPDHSTP